ncbi:MAG: chorismate mutase [Candidatus Eisenbacteria bacterium]
MPLSTRIAAVRGAIQVPANRAEAIRASSARPLEELVRRNGLKPERIVSAIFTATPDLTADFPAHAARKLGWSDVPLLGATEVDVPHALPRVVRVLLTVEGAPARRRLAPVYLDGAEALRPDLASPKARRASQPGADATRIALIGLGQIGGSLGLALGRAGGYERVGFDRDPRVARAALRAGAIDRIARTLETACRDAVIAVAAAPVDALPALLDRAASAMPRGAVLMDTGSARRGVTEALARAAKRGVRAVGGHPIAGNEGRGLPSARADLFEGASFALLPVRGSAVPAAARALVRAVGAKALVVTAAARDRALARTSHLPYLLSLALAKGGAAAARRGLAGPGYRGMTRLAQADPRVARAYCRANHEEVARAWREVRLVLDRATR